MKTVVEILGHKAKIERVVGQPKDDQSLFLARKEDHLAVWLSFQEFEGHVDGTISFAVLIPAKKYADRDEFLYNVRRRGEEALERMLERNAQARAEGKYKVERQAAMDALAAEAQKLIE